MLVQFCDLARRFFGKAVITTSRNTPVESGVLTKASSGAIERIPLIRVSNLSVAMKVLKDHGCWLIGLDPLGEDELENVIQATSDVKIGFVMGSEGRGIKRIGKESMRLFGKNCHQQYNRFSECIKRSVNLSLFGSCDQKQKLLT